AERALGCGGVGGAGVGRGGGGVGAGALSGEEGAAGGGVVVGGGPIRRDYDRARAELALAQQSLPNNAQVYELAGSMDCRQRRWADATNNLERACEIDPLNFPYLINLASTYLWLHDYDQHARIMDRIVALHPELRPGRI